MKKLNINTVCGILKQIRKKKHLSQSEVAHYSSLTQNDLSNFENGKKDIRLSTLERIATALDMIILPIPKNKLSDIEQLLCEESEETITPPKTLLEQYGISDDEE